MKVAILVVLAVLLGVATCAPPSISADFSSRITWEIIRTHEHRIQHGHVYEDFDDQMQRFDLRHEGGGRMEIIGFYETGNQTEYILTHEKCFHRNLNGPLPNRWAWLSTATAGGSCIGEQSNGTLWEATSGNITTSVCVDVNGNPLKLVYRWNPSKIDADIFTFHDWYGYKPPASDFQLPEVCFGHKESPMEEKVFVKLV